MSNGRHPTLNNELPTAFWETLEDGIVDALAYQNASIYYRAYGWIDGAMEASEWRDVTWTLNDFAYFYHCPESADAFARFRDDYLRNHPLEKSPSWQEVVDAMERVLGQPERIPDFLHLRPDGLIDKSTWVREDHWVAYILRLLRYRKMIERLDPANLDEFQTRVYNYARTFGRDNPFYYEWDACDKWVASYLLYAKLSHEKDVFTVKYIQEHPGVIPPPPADVHPVVRDVVEEREEEERKKRERERVEFRNNQIRHHHLLSTFRRLAFW
ncbi:hypothetical protein M434DRAFT_15962 [Hypoxylon sp. CO27-5]|nr:hypothetical protein M434DRAFT_15962 [Hypoxylon sp. CO27-5]